MILLCSVLHTSFVFTLGNIHCAGLLPSWVYFCTRSDTLLVSASRENWLPSINPNIRVIFLQIFPIQLLCQILRLLLVPPKCTKRAMPEPIGFLLIRWPYGLSRLLVIISMSSRASQDQPEKSIARGSWCHLTINTESDPWCSRLEIHMSSHTLCRTDHILCCLLMPPPSTEEPI